MKLQNRRFIDRLYGYSLFNLEAMAAICQLLSTPGDNLWSFELADGRGMRKAMDFMAPYIRKQEELVLSIGRDV